MPDEGRSCPFCAETIRADVTECPHCGEDVMQSCRFCAEKIDVGATECPFCHESLGNADREVRSPPGWMNTKRAALAAGAVGLVIVVAIGVALAGGGSDPDPSAQSDAPSSTETRSTTTQPPAPETVDGWTPHSSASFNALIPDAGWPVVEAPDCCLDISSPSKDAFASFAYGQVPRPYTTIEARDLALSTTSNVQILQEGAPFNFAGGTRQVTEYTGVMNGIEVHGVVTVDVFTLGGVNSIDAYLKAAEVGIWTDIEPRLQLILDHINFLRR